MSFTSTISLSGIDTNSGVPSARAGMRRDRTERLIRTLMILAIPMLNASSARVTAALKPMDRQRFSVKAVFGMPMPIDPPGSSEKIGNYGFAGVEHPPQFGGERQLRQRISKWLERIEPLLTGGVGDHDVIAAHVRQCLARLPVETEEIAGSQTLRRRQHLQRRLDPEQLGIDRLHQRARGRDRVAFEDRPLLLIGNGEQEHRSQRRRQNAADDQTCEPKANGSLMQVTFLMRP